MLSIKGAHIVFRPRGNSSYVGLPGAQRFALNREKRAIALDAAVFDDVNMRHAAPLTLADEPDRIVRDQHRQESGQTVMHKRYQGWMEHAKEIDPNHATWMTVKDQISLTYPHTPWCTICP